METSRIVTKGVAKPEGQLRVEVPVDASVQSVQWYADGVKIDGAIETVYVVQAGDSMKKIHAEAIVLDSQGTRVLVSSERAIGSVPLNDNNRDGASEIMFRHENGQRFSLDTKATSENDGRPEGQLIDTNQLVLVDSDFNGQALLVDPVTETVFLQNVNAVGQAPVELTNVHPLGLESLGARQSVDLRLVSTIDADADGVKEILWLNNSTGRLSVDNQTVVIDQEANSITGSTVLAVADYDGNGSSDILLQTSDRALRVLELNGNQVERDGFITSVMPNGRLPENDQVVDARGDYNGDGNVDVLLRDIQTGELSQLQLNGKDVLRVSVVDTRMGNVPTQYEVLSAHSDFNGDQKSDILWVNNQEGSTYISISGGVDGSELVTTSLIENLPDWRVVTADVDINSDGKNDLIALNTVTNEMALVRMDGTSFLDAPTIMPIPEGWNPELVSLTGQTSSEVQVLASLLPGI